MKLPRDLSAAHVAGRLVRRYRYRVIPSRGSRMTAAGRRSASGDHAAASGRADRHAGQDRCQYGRVPRSAQAGRARRPLRVM